MLETKDVAYYRRLPYTRQVDLRRDSDGSVYYVARIKEMPSLRMDGETREEALLKLDETFDDWIESMLEMGDEIPEPDVWPGVPASPILTPPVSLPVVDKLPVVGDAVYFSTQPQPWTSISTRLQTVGAGV